jgi:hypothetical protein
MHIVIEKVDTNTVTVTDFGVGRQYWHYLPKKKMWVKGEFVPWEKVKKDTKKVVGFDTRNWWC